MTPVLLAIIGTVCATYASLGAALKSTGNTRRLAHLSLSLPLVALASWVYRSSSSSLGLLGYAQQQRDLLSLTLQYDQPEKGLAVLETPLYLAHPYQETILGALVVLATVTLVSVLVQKTSKLKGLMALLSGAWITLWLVWFGTHQSIPWSSHNGESATREFLKLSQFDWQRVTQFTVPEPWYYSSQLLPLIALSLVSAFYLLYSSLNQSNQEASTKQQGGWHQYVFNIGAILCVAATLWSSLTLGFSGSSSELSLWISTLLVGSAGATCLPNIQRGTVAMLASLALVSTLL